MSVLEMGFEFHLLPSFKIAFLAGKHFGPVLAVCVLFQKRQKVGFKWTFETMKPFWGHALRSLGHRDVVVLAVHLVEVYILQRLPTSWG